MPTNTCPLCHADLGLSDKPQPPSETISLLERHFGVECPATSRVLEALVAKAPDRDGPGEHRP